jgi:hypothetical protein
LEEGGCYQQILLVCIYFANKRLFSKLCFHKSWQWNKIEHEIGEGEGSWEGEVDGNVGPGFEYLVQLDTRVAVPLNQVVGSVQIPFK